MQTEVENLLNQIFLAERAESPMREILKLSFPSHNMRQSDLVGLTANVPRVLLKKKRDRQTTVFLVAMQIEGYRYH